MAEGIKKSKNFFLELGYFVAGLILILSIFALTAFLPLPGSWKAKLDSFYLEAGRRLMFIPSYYLPLSSGEYSYYDPAFGKNVRVGYGYVNSIKYELFVPDDVNSDTVEQKMNIGVRGRWLGKDVSFEMKNQDFEDVVISFFYVRGDEFLPSGMYFEREDIIEWGKTLSYRQPIFASFRWIVTDISQGDFVRYFRDESGKLL